MATTKRQRITKTPSQPGDDQPIGRGSDLTVLQAIRAYRDEADAARQTRLDKSEKNRQAYLGEQDWSHKQRGQSREVLPKTPMAVEQIAAFFKRALTDFGRWFGVDLPPNSPIDPNAVINYLGMKLETLSRAGGGRLDFPTLLGDGIKVGLLESLVIFKVHGRYVGTPKYVAERGMQLVEVPYGGNTYKVPQQTSTLTQQTVTTWQLCIDLVRPTDYLPDPTGRGLYEIHECERDLAEVVALSEGEGAIYDPAAVALIQEDVARLEEAWERARATNQDESPPPAFRKRVVLHEFWGTLLDNRGRVIAERQVATMANDRYLIRPPEANPFWHGQSPFVCAPLVRVPFSVWHKALFDHAVGLNTALNELFSLMLDGGIASVWGTRQLRVGMLEDPKQVQHGIPQGTTLVVKDELPTNVKVLETVTDGQVPPDAMAMFNTADREFQGASMVNDIRLGNLPQRQTKATEIVEASNNSAVMFDGLVRDVENDVIEKVLWKAWLTTLQHADDLDSEEVIGAIGLRNAFILARMSPAERFAAFAGATFRVSGLTAVTARARDFQKKVALMQVIGSNPLLIQAWVKRFSPDKYLTGLIRDLNLNPDQLELTEDEKAVPMQDRMAQVAQASQITGAPGRGGSVRAEESGGDTGMPAEVNQSINPLSGMTANA